MSGEEIRKLLGGYATNTLTDSERSALFAAALDDQDLFNALQDEQALKQLLADPASRQAIRLALEPSPAAERRSAWWSRRWMWSGAIAAVAATVLIVAVVHRQLPEPAKTPVEIAANQEPAKPKASQPEPPELPINGRRRDLATVAPQRTILKAAAPPAAPPPPAPAENVTVEAAPQAASGVVGSLTGVPAIAGGLLPAPQPPVRYSLVKSDAQGLYSAIPADTELKPGDSVRLNVSPSISGYLSLEQLTPLGEWERVFPDSPPGRLVAPNTAYAIPDSGITVENDAQKFRISLQPQALAKPLAAQRMRAAAEAQVAQDAKDTAPLTVEITIAPGKVP